MECRVLDCSGWVLLFVYGGAVMCTHGRKWNISAYLL